MNGTVLNTGDVEPVHCQENGSNNLYCMCRKRLKRSENLKGYVQIYTGNGKGKTTAAFGLALRAVGNGMKVFIGQFIKGMHYSELDAFTRFSDFITIRQYGRNCFIENKPESGDINCAGNGFNEVSRIIRAGGYQVVILDEINIAVHLGLIAIKDLITLLETRPPEVELVLTGRYAHPDVIEHADLVTEMKEIKHYYSRGIMAREGIEK